MRRVLLVAALVALASGCGGGGSKPYTAKPRIWGTVSAAEGVPGGPLLAGVTLTLNNSTTASSSTTQSDEAGEYAFEDLDDGDYELSVSRIGYFFGISKFSFSLRGGYVVGSNGGREVRQDFLAGNFEPPLLTVSGHVSGTDGSGVWLHLTGDIGERETAIDADGNYSFATLPPGSYTITPSGGAYEFTPAQLPVELVYNDVTGKDFAAVRVFQLRGEIDGAFQGVTVQATGAKDVAENVDVIGFFQFDRLPEGSYTFTPSAASRGFVPRSWPITLNAGGWIPTFFAFDEFAVPTSGSDPTALCLGQDNRLWFTERGSNRIGRIAAGGTITEYDAPVASDGLRAIAPGPDGNLWFTAYDGNAIGVTTLGGLAIQYPIGGSSPSGPYGIVAGPDTGAQTYVWFTEHLANRIGRIATANGLMTHYSTPTADSRPLGIVRGGDGNFWFTESGTNKIGKITPAGVITEYALPSSSARPAGIAVDGAGHAWFTEPNAGKIGLIAWDGTITEYTVGGAPDLIAAHGNGRLYFTDGPSIRSFVPASSSAAATGITGLDAAIQGLAVGPDGRIWFTEQSGRIGRIDP